MNPRFFARFYANFLRQSPLIAPMFARRDMAKQRRLLRAGISFLLQYAQGNDYAALRVGDLAASHSRNRHNINPNMYPLWIDALMMTVQEFDEQFTPDLRNKWVAALRVSIERMISQYSVFQRPTVWKAATSSQSISITAAMTPSGQRLMRR